MEGSQNTPESETEQDLDPSIKGQDEDTKGQSCNH